MKNIAVFASGNGSNFQAVVEAIKKGKVRANLSLLVCDNPKAFVLERAKRLKIRVFLVERKSYETKKDFEKDIIKVLEAHKIDLIVMAGFMRMLGEDLVRCYRGRILNIHPALLPSFKGAHAIKDAYDYGAKITGVTIHFVDEKMDHGPIVLQEALSIDKKDTLSSLEAKIHKIEHRLYPYAIKLFVQDKLHIIGRKAVIR